MKRWLLVISREELGWMVSADSALAPLPGESLRTVGLEPLPMVSVPGPVIPRIKAEGPVTVTAPTLKLLFATPTVAPPPGFQVADAVATPPVPAEAAVI